MNITILENLEACRSRRDQWNRLAARISADVGLTFEWHWALQRAHKMDLRIAWIENQGELIGILPWYVEKRDLRKVPLSVASPLTNVFTNHDALLLKDRSVRSIRRVLGALEQHGLRWNAFTFPASPDAAHPVDYAGFARTIDSDIEIEHTYDSPQLVLSGTADEFLAGKSKNFRYNIRRKTRALEGAGEFEIRKLTDAADIDDAMECIYAIERQSWKEAAGTSITARAWEALFYESLSELTAEQGWWRVYLLMLDGQPIGYDYALLYQGRYFMLKTSFVESFSKLSPGTVLRWKVVQDLFDEGALEHDFLGEPDAYKMAWASDKRTHQSITVFNRGLRTSVVQGLGRIMRFSRRNTDPQSDSHQAP